MELWIRSQDKMLLIKVGILSVKEDKNGVIGILNYCNSMEWFRLGIYKTKERALEVLDEIQIEISKYLGTKSEIVYEMPEE